jgi:hypothetical protein
MLQPSWMQCHSTFIRGASSGFDIHSAQCDAINATRQTIITKTAVSSFRVFSSRKRGSVSR